MATSNWSLFLSTLSLRRATKHPLYISICPCYFYPRSPCGERQETLRRRSAGILISIHALLAESDILVFVIFLSSTDFYPRSPCGERQRWSDASGLTPIISIHALLAESDKFRPVYALGCREFLSTLSLRRATLVLGCIDRHTR